MQADQYRGSFYREARKERVLPLGINALHPVSGEKVQVWAANFVLMGYGTGAIMCVPGHDQRDWEFARKHGIDIRQVIRPVDGSTVDLSQGAYVEYGETCNSGQFDGLDYAAAFDAVAGYLQDLGRGQPRTNVRLRDWGVSRQRYWGCPIPVIYDDEENVYPVPAQDLPVVLPEDIAFEGVKSRSRATPDFIGPGFRVRPAPGSAKRIRSILSLSHRGISPGSVARTITVRCWTNEPIIGCP